MLFTEIHSTGDSCCVGVCMCACVRVCVRMWRHDWRSTHTLTTGPTQTPSILTLGHNAGKYWKMGRTVFTWRVGGRQTVYNDVGIITALATCAGESAAVGLRHCRWQQVNIMLLKPRKSALTAEDCFHKKKKNK